MSLHQPTVLVLNAYWTAIAVKSPAEAFCALAAGAALGLDIQSEEWMVAVPWAEWLALPVRPHDTAVQTLRGPVRQPTVIVARRYTRVPLHQPSFGPRGIWERDGGICQYTGRKLERHEGNIDHVLPRSRGGPSSWENCVLAHHEVNSRKADRLPHEAGLRLRARPRAPKALPSTVLIRNVHHIADWQRFLP